MEPGGDITHTLFWEDKSGKHEWDEENGKRKTGGVETSLGVIAIIQEKGNEIVNEGATLRKERP